ncbi:MAG: ATP-binding protein [Propionibacteriales bacterium]|nr:ATP-binding protein [Propionibacteriales bacterium]
MRAEVITGPEKRRSGLACAAGRTVVWATVVTVLAFVGRRTIIDGTALSMVWPAAGGALLWFGTSRSTRPVWWVLNAAVLMVVTGGVNHLTGAPWRTVPVFMAANLVQVLVGVVILRKTAPGLWVSGGRGSLRSTADLWALSVAALTGALVGAGLGAGGMIAVNGTWTVEDFLAWWGRNAAGIIAVVGLALLMRRYVDGLPDHLTGTARLRAAGAAVRRHAREVAFERRIELPALLLFTALVYWSAFVHYENLPMAFPLMIATVWAGLRFDAVVVHLHSLVLSGLVVALSLNGVGPFAQIGDVHVEAMVSQLYIGLTITFGLALSLGRDERQALVEELSEAKRAASAHAGRLAALIDQMNDGVSLVGGDGTVILRNPAGRRILGKLAASSSISAEASRREYEVLTVELQPITAEDWPLHRAIDSGEQVSQDLIIRRADGTEPDQMLEVVVTPFVGADQAVVVYRDVTEQRAQLRSIESFAAIVAHDLNTPLTAIDGWVEVALSELAESELDPVALTQMLNRVHRSAVTMRVLIRDLLTFSQAKNETIEPERVDLMAVGHAAAQLRREANPGVRTEVRIGDLPAVLAEPALIRQVFDNLIGNATKYVAPGSVPFVTVSGRVLLDTWAEITVTDNGIGIPAEKQAHIFEAFYRAHPDYTGHGLGLAICKRIVDRYGGHIRVQDNPEGPGTQFVFTLPAAPSSKRVRRPAVHHPSLAYRRTGL